MSKDLIIPHDKISNGQTITGVMDAEFKKAGLNMHVNEATDITDDFNKGVRKVTVQTPRLTFVCPALPWHTKGKYDD